jgi:hypothetical protein
MSTGLLGRAWSAMAAGRPGTMEGYSKEILLDPPREIVQSPLRRELIPATRCVHEFVVQRTPQGVQLCPAAGGDAPPASIAICGTGEPASIATAAASRFFEGRPGERAVGVTVIQSALF